MDVPSLWALLLLLCFSLLSIIDLKKVARASSRLTPRTSSASAASGRVEVVVRRTLSTDTLVELAWLKEFDLC